jgi:hypothetical protein
MIKLLLMIFSIGIISGLSAESASANEAPWDTVMAKLQIIESSKEPDSVKTILTQDLFSEYNLTADDYGKFYAKFLKRSPEQQVKFLKKVEDVILEMIKQQQEQMRKEY